MKTRFDFTPLDWIFPPRCIVCKEIVGMRQACKHVCDACANMFTPINAAGAGGTAVYAYDSVRELIHEFKYRDKPRHAYGFAELMARRLTVLNFNFSDFCALAPVPMHKKRERERGYNQAAVLARALSRLAGAPSFPRLLSRIKDTPQQSSLNHGARVENLKGAIAVNRETARAVETLCEKTGKGILLIDDVRTTGATLSACVTAINEAINNPRVIIKYLAISEASLREPL